MPHEYWSSSRTAEPQVRAPVSGNEIYEVKARIQPLAAARWKAVRRECAGQIGTLVELLADQDDVGVATQPRRGAPDLIGSLVDLRGRGAVGMTGSRFRAIPRVPLAGLRAMISDRERRGPGPAPRDMRCRKGTDARVASRDCAAARRLGPGPVPGRRMPLRGRRAEDAGAPAGARSACIRVRLGTLMLDLVVQVSAELASRGIAHAMIGAGALAVHGISRST